MAKPKPKPLTYKTGTYSAKAGPESKFSIVLKRASCASAVVPGASLTTGQSSFSVTFTKKGTASGYVEVNLMIAAGPTQAPVPCSSGKVPFTAKLG